MQSRKAVAQIAVWGSRTEVWWASSRAASTSSKGTASKGASKPAVPAPAAATKTPATAKATKATAQKVRAAPKPSPVSPTLRHFLGGVAEATRPGTLKHVWDYIKEHKLQDPADKKQVICDAKLKTVLGKDRLNFTELLGLLSPHFPKQEGKKSSKS